MQIVTIDVDQALPARVMDWMSQEERERATRFRCARSRQQFVTTRLALRAQLGRRLGSRPAEVAFRYEDGGKPYVAELREQGTEFSVSHSGARSLIAISDSGDIGIDIEERRPIEVRELAAAYFTAAESALLTGREEIACLADFYRIWVRKEAAAKALGCGIGIGLDRFETVRHGLGLMGTWVRMPDGTLWPCRELRLDRRFEAVVVSRDILPDRLVDISSWTPDEEGTSSIAAATAASPACARIQ